MAFEFEILEHIKVLSKSTNGWQKELTLTSWNNYPAKFDIRDWSPDYRKMGKGTTLTNEEFQALKEAIYEMDE